MPIGRTDPFDPGGVQQPVRRPRVAGAPRRSQLARRRGALQAATILLLAFAVSGCAGGRRGPALPAPDLLRRAEEKLERGKFRDAETAFREFLERHPGDADADRAQLGLARSLLGVRQWGEARAELTTFLERYPDSAWRETARFLMGIAYARESLPAEQDQELTHKALEEFEAYLADFPRGMHRAEAEEERRVLRDKLAEKEVLNGQLYLRLGFPEAAEKEFALVLAQYGESSRVPAARFGLAEIRLRQGRIEEAEAIYRELQGSAPDKSLRKECGRRLEELARRRGGGSPGS